MDAKGMSTALLEKFWWISLYVTDEADVLQSSRWNKVYGFGAKGFRLAMILC